MNQTFVMQRIEAGNKFLQNHMTLEQALETHVAVKQPPDYGTGQQVFSKMRECLCADES